MEAGNVETVLRVEDLRLHYFTSRGPVRAIDGVSFDLERGTTLGIVGESGCGKSTAGMALLNMPPPPGRIVAGSIRLDGRELLGLGEAELRRSVRWEKIAMVFQGAQNSLTPVFTIGAQMRETLRSHRRVDRPAAETMLEESLRRVGLGADMLKRYPHELSGGMKQRVVIATALFLKPPVVVLDEPTTALDVIMQAQILNLLKELKQSDGLSFIFITHDLAVEAEIADRLAVMYAGKIVEIASNELFFGPAGPCHPYAQRLLAATPRLTGPVGEPAFIPGAPPDLLSPPEGCRFHPRCDEVIPRCRTEEPPLVGLADGRRTACWRRR